MASKLPKYLFYVIAAIILFSILSPTPTGKQPALLTKFQPTNLVTSMNEKQINLNRLANAHYIKLPQAAVQDVIVTKNGDIYAFAGTGPSYLYKISHQNLTLFTKITETPGRVLGTAINKQQNLIAFMDETEGLRLYNLKTNEMKTLVSQYQGKKLVSLNSVTFGPTSDILYFTHSCQFSMQEYHLQILYKTQTGSIFQLTIPQNKLKILVDNLSFPNGIAYSQKQNCLYVAQINWYRILKVPLSAPSSYSTLIDNLPGYPDNVKLSPDGHLWVGLPSLRDPLNVFIDNHPIVRKMLINLRIPEGLFTQAANMKYAGGLKIDPKTAQIVDYFLGKSDNIYFVTGITERAGKVYMASLKKNLIGVVDYI